MRFVPVIALLSLTASAPLAAQGPAQPAGLPGVRGAQFLLARTGELELTDQQVVRLAAIARRSAARRRSLRATMDSARARFGGEPTAADSAARRQFRERMRADIDRAREQARTDQRDAIAVLTPEQQARAWEMVGNRNRGMRGMRERGMGRMRGPRPRPRNRDW